jgi:hypothetical protein
MTLESVYYLGVSCSFLFTSGMMFKRCWGVCTKERVLYLGMSLNFLLNSGSSIWREFSNVSALVCFLFIYICFYIYI